MYDAFFSPRPELWIEMLEGLGWVNVRQTNDQDDIITDELDCAVYWCYEMIKAELPDEPNETFTFAHFDKIGWRWMYGDHSWEDFEWDNFWECTLPQVCNWCYKDVDERELHEEGLLCSKCIKELKE